VQLLAIPGINDTQCGFKCFRGDLARDLFRRCRIDGFSFDVEVLFIARSQQLKIAEIGVLWKNSPESKVHPVRDSLQMLRDLLRIRHYSWCGHYLPPAVLRVSTEA
jgi:dolichyl-phosphate beta-glucosyltransferase